MNSDEAKELLIDYINGFLSEEQRQQIDALLQQDDELRLEYDSLRQEMGILQRAFTDPYESARLKSISIGVMSELRSKRTTGFRGLPLAVRSYLRAAAVVSLIVIAVGIFFLLRPGFVSEPTEELIVAEAEQSLDDTPDETAEEESEVLAEDVDEKKPETIRLAFATSDPKVRIYWTLSRDFDLPNGGE